MTFPLTKVMQTEDLAHLQPALARVDAVGTPNQTHEARRWEYALALTAIVQWVDEYAGTRTPRTLIDVGGGGSLFTQMLNPIYWDAQIIDPSVNLDLHAYVQESPTHVDVVTCLSVLEHVDSPAETITDCIALLKPGGLLIVTIDCWDQDGPDTAHFHWMRKRIFSMPAWQQLVHLCASFGCSPYGDVDFQYHGATLYGSYAVASLVTRKAL